MMLFFIFVYYLYEICEVVIGIVWIWRCFGVVLNRYRALFGLNYVGVRVVVEVDVGDLNVCG